MPWVTRTGPLCVCFFYFKLVVIRVNVCIFSITFASRHGALNRLARPLASLRGSWMPWVSGSGPVCVYICELFRVRLSISI